MELTEAERKVREVAIETATHQSESHIQEALKEATEVREAAAQTVAFKTFVAELHTDLNSRTADINDNNLPDSIERDSGGDPTKGDEISGRLEGDLGVLRNRFVARGCSHGAAEDYIGVIRRRIREQRRRLLIEDQALVRYSLELIKIADKIRMAMVSPMKSR